LLLRFHTGHKDREYVFLYAFEFVVRSGSKNFPLLQVRGNFLGLTFLVIRVIGVGGSSFGRARALMCGELPWVMARSILVNQFLDYGSSRAHGSRPYTSNAFDREAPLKRRKLTGVIVKTL
jgi:hypothetical protein